MCSDRTEWCSRARWFWCDSSTRGNAPECERGRDQAQIFCIGESGVEFHRKHIRRKLKLGREERLPIVLGAM
jgi:hypothetical protein